MSSSTNPTEQPTHHSQTADALEKLEEDFQKTTNIAVAEGQENVNEATSTYLQKALSLADFGLGQAETYVTMGKEKLNSPHATGPAPTGIAATFASTATAALDALHGGLGMAHQTLHDKAPQFPHAHQQGPAHPVTVPSKSISEALHENVTVAASIVQPHVDAAKGAAQPHIDAASAAVQPHIDAASAAAQPHIDAASAAAQPHIDAAKGLVQPHVDAAVAGAQVQIDAVKGVVNSDKSYTQQAQEAAQPAVDAAQPHVDAASGTVSSYTESAKAKATETLNSVTTTSEAKETEGAAL